MISRLKFISSTPKWSKLIKLNHVRYCTQKLMDSTSERFRKIIINEHRIIQNTMDAFAEFLFRIEENDTENYDIKDINKFMDFFLNYIEIIHHGKEQDIIYAQLNRLNPNYFIPDNGSFGMVTAQKAFLYQMIQDLNRDIFSCLQNLNNNGELTKDIILFCKEYRDVLLNHIRHESNTFIPLILNNIQDKSELNKIADEMETFNNESQNDIERLQNIAKYLQNLYD